ncbi:M20/M25/M40 family metallo-hydrolase [Planctomycetota bacterium]
MKLANVLGVLPGTNPDKNRESVVVGAHYDHLGLGWPDVHDGDEGEVHNGADDNASGVAVLLELARVLQRSPQERTVIFAAFTGEEAGLLGSRHFLGHSGSYRPEGIVGMVNLDTVGRLESRKLTVFGVGSARQMIHVVMGAGYVTGLETEPVSDDPGGSDQVSFLEKGVPAIQLFTGPHADYHRPGDDPEKLDYGGMVRVAAFAKEIIDYLAATGTPPTPTIAGSSARPEGKQGPRKVSLGTVPDFGYKGSGVRISGVVPGSAAEHAGLREGDVVTGIDDTPIASLRDLSDQLKQHRPGDRISISYVRDGKQLSTSATLGKR